MKIQWIVGLACLALAVTPGTALAQKKVSPAVGKACLTAAQTCSTDCNATGYCLRMVCEAGKWKKRMVGCFGNLCPPKC